VESPNICIPAGCHRWQPLPYRRRQHRRDVAVHPVLRSFKKLAGECQRFIELADAAEFLFSRLKGFFSLCHTSD